MKKTYQRSSLISRRGRSTAYLHRTTLDHRRLRFEPLEDRRLLAVFSVTSLDDAGPGSLRDTISQANNSPGADEIVFTGAAAYGAIALTTGELEISDTLTITSVDASGNVRTIDAQQLSRVFHFSSATGDLTLEGLRVTGGLSESAGGGILFASSGTLTLNHCGVDHNSTTGENASGGGIATGLGSVSIFDSSVNFNSTAGENAHGGGIATESGSVSIYSSEILGNDTMADHAHGGGIFSNADVYLTESKVHGNSTAGPFAGGGGVYTSANLSLNSSTISYNNTLEENAPGGGVHSRGNVLINGSTIRNNYTRGFGSYGGGVFSMGDMTLTGSTVTENDTYGDSAYGGGLHAQVGKLSLTESTVRDNATHGDRAVGGGVSAGTVSITNSTINKNRTQGEHAPGGGISAGSATQPGGLTLTGSTVSGNEVSGNYSNAAGIRAYGPTSILSSTITGNEGRNVLNAVGGILVRTIFVQIPFNVENSIVTGNTDNGVAPDLAAGQRVNLKVNHSLIGDTTGSTITEATGDGNLLNLPALLGPLADNGGPTWTHALLPASRAIDAGDPSFVVTTDQHDQRGAPFDRVNRGRIDMGAYETVELRVNDNAADIDDGDPDNGVMTLREAINLANASPAVDTITFDADVFGQSILLGGTELEITDTLTIAGPGPELLRIDAQQGSRVINFSSLSGDLTLEGITVTGGQTAQHGGGILFSSNGALTLISSTVSANSTTGDYGFGGGIRTSAGSVSLTNSTVSGNSTTGPTASGGGISTFSGSVSLTSSTLSGNRTMGRYAGGGGISTISGGVSLTSSTISGNTSEGRYGKGGGIYTSFGSVSLSRSTISNNAASGAFATGGGIGAGDGSTGNPVFTMENSIVAGNTARGRAPDLKPKSGTAFTINHSLIGDPSGSVSAGQLQFAITSGVGNQQNVDPLLGPLADNGGPTQTHALLPGSPAIDAGGAANLPLTDQRGFPFLRSYNDPIAAGAGPDIGAYELQPFVEVLSLIVSSTSDVFDNNFSPGQVSLREAIVLANANPGPDTITFGSLFDTPQAILLDGSEMEITDTLTITGPGQDLLTIDARQNSRVLHFSALTGDLTLAGVTLTGGRTNGDNPRFFSNVASETTHSGGAIRFLSAGVLSLTSSTVSGNSTAGYFAMGGAIFSATGDVSLTGSTVSGKGSTGDGASGGGIATLAGDVSLTHSTVSSNSTTGPGASGGGIDTRSGAVTLNSSTISGNSTAGDSARGGGIANSHGGAILLSSSTVVGNSTAGIFSEGGGVGFNTFDIIAPVTIENSIVAGNTGRGVSDEVSYFGDRVLTINHSLIGDASSTPGSLFYIQQAIDDGTGNLQNLDPLLGPLADNGGPTLTHALLAGSPVLDAGETPLTLAVHEYELNAAYTDAFGGPALVPLGGTLTAGVYQFGPNQGLNLSSANIDTSTYSLEVSFTLSAVGSWQKIIDFADRTTDVGFYVDDQSQLNFYDAGSSTAVLAAGVQYDLLVTRNGATDTVHVYLDGVEVMSFIDTARIAVPSNRIGMIRFFQDDDSVDSGLEAGTGSVDRILVYDRALTASEAAQLATPLNPYDQRGVGFPRLFGAAYDIGAFEAQEVLTASSADFDNDGDIDGRDFLAWQRGFGTPSAAKTDGDADNDLDVDGDDLKMWQTQYGTVPPLASLKAVNLSAPSLAEPQVSSSPLRAESPLSSRLVDAALALQSSNDGGDAEASFMLPDDVNLETLTTNTTLAPTAPPLPAARKESPAQEISAESEAPPRRRCRLTRRIATLRFQPPAVSESDAIASGPSLAIFRRSSAGKLLATTGADDFLASSIKGRYASW